MCIKTFFKFSALLLLSIIVTFGVLAIYKFPKFSYKIETSEISTQKEEIPLTLTYDTDKNTLKYLVFFSDDVDNSESAKLITKPIFTTTPPFYTYNYDLSIQLNNEDQKSGDQQVYYMITGDIKGLKPGDYKVRITDPNGNLVDEKYITIE